MAARRWKWILLVLLILIGVVIVVANAYRDSIGREIINRGLKDSEYRVTDLSVESLAQDSISLSELVLERTDGMQLEVGGVTLPVDLRERRLQSLSIGQVRYVPAPGNNRPETYASIVQTGLAAHTLLPDAEVFVGELETPWLPVLVDIEWQSAADSQSIRFEVADYRVEGTAARGEDDGYALQAQVMSADDAQVATFSGTSQSAEDALLLNGDTTVDLEFWLPALHALGAVPAEIPALVGEFRGPVDVVLPHAITQEATSLVELRATIAVDNAVNLTWKQDEGETIDVSLTTTGPVGASFYYPSLDWEARAAEALARIRMADNEFELMLESVACESGVTCVLDALYETDFVGSGGASVEALAVRAPLTVSVGDATLVESRDEVAVDVRGAGFGDYVLDEIALTGHIRGSADTVDAELAIAAGAATGKITVTHDIESGNGQLRAIDVLLPFEEQKASRVFRAWKQAWDVVGGELSAGLEASWRIAHDETTYRVGGKVTLDQLSGQLNDMIFSGLSTRLEVYADDQVDPRIAPFDVGIDLFEIGLPVENIRASIAPDLTSGVVTVSDLQMQTLGGQITADSFDYNFQTDSNSLVLEPSGIQLQLMVDVAESSGIEVDGSVSGRLPVALSESGVTIDGGHLANDPPGGAIRLGDRFAGMTDDSRFGFVTDALSNFRFDSLTADVTYTEQGDLLMQMRIEGANPDMDPDQPVVLNLGLENNVPQLLKSLQAGRSISDILGRKVAQ